MLTDAVSMRSASTISEASKKPLAKPEKIENKIVKRKKVKVGEWGNVER